MTGPAQPPRRACTNSSLVDLGSASSRVYRTALAGGGGNGRSVEARANRHLQLQVLFQPEHARRDRSSAERSPERRLSRTPLSSSPARTTTKAEKSEAGSRYLSVNRCYSPAARHEGLGRCVGVGVAGAGDGRSLRGKERRGLGPAALEERVIGRPSQLDMPVPDIGWLAIDWAGRSGKQRACG